MNVPSLPLDVSGITNVLTRFIRDETNKFGFKRLVVGLSGGLDSSTALALAVEALGPENVLAVLMPYRTSSPQSLAHGRELVKLRRTPSREIDITPMVDAYYKNIPEADAVRRGNKMARERMSILFDLSQEWRALVLGTSNKTELLLGYGTLFGDMASALNPLGDLYKTQVRRLAELLDVPRSIIEKKPTADLWEGQTDEEELGFSYDEVDRLLYLMVDLRFGKDALLEAGFAPDFVERVGAALRNSQFKRLTPIIAKVSPRTINCDFRYPRDWGR